MNRVEAQLPRGVEGNRVLLAQTAVVLDYRASMAKIANQHRKEVKVLAKKIGKSTLPWVMRRFLNG